MKRVLVYTVTRKRGVSVEQNVTEANVLEETKNHVKVEFPVSAMTLETIGLINKGPQWIPKDLVADVIE